jgi:hypothetical protein
VHRTPYRSPGAAPASVALSPWPHADGELLPVYTLVWLACGARVYASVLHGETSEHGAIIAAILTALLPIMVWQSLRSMWLQDVKDP